MFEELDSGQHVGEPCCSVLSRGLEPPTNKCGIYSGEWRSAAGCGVWWAKEGLQGMVLSQGPMLEADTGPQSM